MNIDEQVKNNQITLVVMPKSKYHEGKESVLRAIDACSKKVCYVTINKPFNAVITDLQGMGLNPGKYFFVDAITATVKMPAIVPNCEFIQSPSALTEMSMAFTKAMGEMGCDNAVFDTISTLTVYQDVSEIMKLTHALITKARVNNTHSVYMAMKEDNTELIKDMTMFVDAIIEI